MVECHLDVVEVVGSSPSPPSYEAYPIWVRFFYYHTICRLTWQAARRADMRVFDVANNSIKSVMNQLLKGSAFDNFLVRGVEISVFTRFEISGILDKNYYPEAERGAINRNYVYWHEVKPFIFSLIKGGRAPGMLKIIFSAADEDVKNLHNNASAMFLNFLYEENKLRFTSAVGLQGFTLDKTPDLIWDAYVQSFISKNEWTVSTLN